MPCRSTTPQRRTGSSPSAGTWARSCSRREAADADPALAQPPILARVALAGPLRAVGLVVVELDDEAVVWPAQVDLVVADRGVHLGRAESPQCFVFHAAPDQRLTRCRRE